MRSTMKQLINGWLSWFFDLLSMKQCPSFFTKFCENPPDNSATDKVRSVCCLYFFKWFIRTKCTPLFTLFQWSCDLRKFTHRCKKNVVFGSYFDQQVSNMLWAANWMYWCHTRASFLREIGMQCKPESWYLFPEGWSNFISDRHQLVLVSVHLQLFMCWSHCMHNCISCFFHIGLEEFSAVVIPLSSLVSVLLNGVWVTDRIRTGYRRFRWCDCPPPQRTDSLQCYSSIQPMLLANFLVFFILSHFIYL